MHAIFLNIQVLRLFYYFCLGTGCLSQGKGGAERKFKVKRESLLTGTSWGHNSHSASLYICDGFRALAAVLPGCLAMVVKSHRTWILPLCFHPPAQCNANGGPQGSHLNPPSNGAPAPARAPCMSAPPKFSIKAVHAAARGSLLVSRWLSHI